MNRFLKTKKSKEGLTPSPNEEHPPFDLPVPSPQPAPKRKWGKKKKQPEPEPEPNITIELPSSENFRTSLMMPNLSARFSMLRDQDNPKSVLGKASDDSVLSPRRRSQLGVGQFLYSSGLSDIDEVSSLHDSIRPPFADARQHSFVSDPGLSAQDDSAIGSGSIMSRARPGEGNVLFGGRQKIYKIPVSDAGASASPGAAADNRGGMRGRALYEDDVSMSAFQRLRKAERDAERERDRRLAEIDYGSNDVDFLSSEIGRSPSMSLYDERRGTSSSTNSGPSLMSASTAATSIAANSPGLPSSSPANVPNAMALDKGKNTRKLYELGLENHLQEQQSAALTRLTSISKRNGRSPSPMAHPKGIPNALEPRIPEDKATPPHSRPWTPREDPLQEQPLDSALKSSDRGKATALGQFKRPKQFSEEQYLQRQMSLLHQNRNKRDFSGNAEGTSTASPDKVPRPAPLDLSRPRKGTDSSEGSWSASPTTTTANSRDRSDSESKDGPVTQTKVKQPLKQTGGTFFSSPGNDSESVDNITASPRAAALAKDPFEDGLPSPGIAAPSQRVPPPLFKHPAMRAGSISPEAKKERRQAWTPGSFSPPKVTPPTAVPASSGDGRDRPILPEKDVPRRDSDALGNVGADSDGLKQLVREHLRTPSNASSIYPNQPSPLAANFTAPRFDLEIPSIYSQTSNPWDNDESEQANNAAARRDMPMSLSSLATKVDDTGTPRQQQHRPPPLEPNWRIELERSHVRGDSSETTHERKAFQSELAERSKAITENLKIKSEARAPSPLAMNLKSPLDEPRSLNPLRKASSRDAVGKHETGRSLKKMARANQSNPSLPDTDGGRSHSQDAKRHGGRDHHHAMSPPAIGRTLHSRLPRASEDYYNSSQNDSDVPSTVGYERPSTSRPPTSRRSPPESSRTSSSQDNASSGDNSQAPSQAPSQHRPSYATDGRPSDDRGRSIENTNRPRTAGKPAGHLDRSTTLPSSLSKDRAFSKNVTLPLNSAASAPSLNTTGVAPIVTIPGSADSPSHSSPTSQPPIFTFPQRKATRQRKNTLDKSQISDPTLISLTSNVDTVALPVGASLRNGERCDVDAVLAGQDLDGSSASPSSPSSSLPPPLPQVNPRRKWGMFGRSDKPATKDAAQDVEDEYITKPGGRLRIRKISSEGAGLNARRKHEAVRMTDDDASNVPGGVF